MVAPVWYAGAGPYYPLQTCYVLRDRGGPRKAGKGARWAIGRFRLAAEAGMVCLWRHGRGPEGRF